MVRKWLNSCGVAEISHFGNCNFSRSGEFKYIGASERKDNPQGPQIRQVWWEQRV